MSAVLSGKLYFISGKSFVCICIDMERQLHYISPANIEDSLYPAHCEFQPAFLNAYSVDGVEGHAVGLLFTQAPKNAVCS